MGIREVETLIDDLLRQTPDIAHQVDFERSPSGYSTWDRKANLRRRHMWVRELDAQSYPGEFGIVWGEYPDWDNPAANREERGFDARSMGSAAYTLKFFQAWIINWCYWQDLPPLEDFCFGPQPEK